MPEREPPMTKIVNLSDACQHWSQILNQVYRKETRVVVEKSGVPVAALVSPDDLRGLQALDQARQRDFAALQVTPDAFKDVPDDELQAEVEKAVAEARADVRAEKARLRQPAS